MTSRPRARHPRTLRPLLAVALLFGSVACDDLVGVENAPPVVKLEGYCERGERYFIAVRVTDLERDPVDLDLYGEVPGLAGRLPTGSAGAGLRGLRSEPGPAGVVHLVEWAPRFEWAPDCARGGCEPVPCTDEACRQTCEEVVTACYVEGIAPEAGPECRACIDTCQALANDLPPEGIGGGCADRPADPPSTLRLTAFATDGGQVTSTDAELSLRAECSD